MARTLTAPETDMLAFLLNQESELHLVREGFDHIPESSLWSELSVAECNFLLCDIKTLLHTLVRPPTQLGLSALTTHFTKEHARCQKWLEKNGYSCSNRAVQPGSLIEKQLANLTDIEGFLLALTKK